MTTTPSKLYVGDVGTVITVNLQSDISAATKLELHVWKPGAAAAVVWTGELEGDDSIRYEVQANDLNVPGKYTLQAYVELPEWQGHGNSVTFNVWPEFK